MVTERDIIVAALSASLGGFASAILLNSSSKKQIAKAKDAYFNLGWNDGYQKGFYEGGVALFRDAMEGELKDYYMRKANGHEEQH